MASVEHQRWSVQLLPREHGAYGQVAFPLVTALAAFGVTRSAVLLASLVIALFLAHEPLLVVAGTRGARARRDLGRAAARSLALLLAVAVASGAAAASMLPSSAAWSLAIPVAAATPAAIALARGAERTWFGETAIAVAAASAAVPVGIAAGGSTAGAASIALAFGVTFVLATWSVRAVILTVRGGGSPVEVRHARVAVVALSIVAVSGFGLAVRGGLLPAATLAASWPGVLVGMGLVLRPPHPSRLRAVGWSLVLTSALVGGLLVTGLR